MPSNGQGSPVSASNFSDNTEDAILRAFNAIHSLNVIHGDVRVDNILVSGDGNAAWIVDFEFSEILSEEDDIRDSKILGETQIVNELLNEVKKSRRSSVSPTNHLSQNGAASVAAGSDVQ